MVSPKRILISNCYSYKNKGDAAIVTCLLRELQGQFPKAVIAVSCHDEDDIKNKVYGVRPYVQNIQKLVFGSDATSIGKAFRSAWFLLRIALFEFLSAFNIRAFWLFGERLREKIHSYESFDAIVACGGGYLVSREKFDIIGNIVFAYDFYLAHIFKKPFVLYSQSIGPFGSRLHLPLLKHYLKNAKLIICREDISYQRLKDAGLKNIRLAADIAFLLRPKKTDLLERYGFSKKEVNVGITVRHWLRKENQRAYETQLCDFIEKFVAISPSRRIYFMPQVIYGANDDNDLVVARRVYWALSGSVRKRVRIIAEDIGPRELLFAIGRMDFFIGTRMHSNIFALLSGVRTVAVGYETKTRGIMEMLGLERYSVGMRALTSETLLSFLDSLGKDARYAKTLRRSLAKVRKLARTDIRGFLSGE